MVFTHGYTMDHEMFAPQVRALARDHRMLVWDVRGHGRSKPLGEFSIPTCAGDLAAIVDHAGMQRAHHVGHSMGGHIVQELAFRQPHRVLSMVMLSSTCLTWRPPVVQVLFGPISQGLLGLWPHAWTTRQIGWIAGLSRRARCYAVEAASHLTKAERRAVWASVLQGFHDEPAYRIGCPLLIMHGRWDLVVGGGLIRALAPAWAAREPHARYEIIPWAAHNAGQDNPRYASRAIATFLRSIS